MIDTQAQHHVRQYLAVFAALMVLLAATVGAAYLRLGEGNIVVALCIAVLKASLVGWFFMHLRLSKPIVTLFALAGVFWLLILIILTYSDFMAR